MATPLSWSKDYTTSKFSRVITTFPSMEIKAKYRFYEYRHQLPPVVHVIDCIALAETEKSYRIKLLAANVRGHKWGDIIWAKKELVTLGEKCRKN